MNNISYHKEMLNIINNLTYKPKLLLHACCAPCSTTCLERLKDYFEITILYYNPNIPENEYQKRLSEMKRYLFETNLANILECPHNEEDFYKIAKGLEKEKEGGKRCLLCFELRLNYTAKIAKENNFEYFATTLTLSPLKNSKAINEIGKNIEKKYSVKYLPSDFKKENGYLRSIELSKQYNLYRQNFCGCIYSQQKEEINEH